MRTSGTGAQQKEEQLLYWDKSEEGREIIVHGIAPKVWLPSTSEDEELTLAVLSPRDEGQGWAETRVMGHVHGRGRWGWKRRRKLQVCTRTARTWHQEPSPDKEMLFATSKQRQELAASSACQILALHTGFAESRNTPCSLHATFLGSKYWGIQESDQGKQPFTGSVICTVILSGQQALRGQGSCCLELFN